MTTLAKQFDKANKPDPEPTHRRTTTEHRSAQRAGTQADVHYAAGNLAIQRLFQSNAQAKFSISQPGDVHEREADRMADQVVAPSSPHALHEGRSIPAASPRRFLQDLGPGLPLDASNRALMEARFGTNFGHVRVHTDAQAVESAQALNARAYTVGQDMVFGAGQYAPGTTEGKKLLAHELTHVVQQEAGYSPRAIQRQGSQTRTTTAPRISMQEFIDIVKRVEADNPGKSALEIEQLTARTKYHSHSWDWLLPSLSSGPQVTEGSSVTASDVALLSQKLIVTLPGGGEADPLHIVVGLVAQAETQAPGSGGAGGLRGMVESVESIFVKSLPSGVSQRDSATWLGDVGQAAAEWMTDHPHPRGGTTKQNYMDEYAPQSDLLGDVDSVAMTSTSGAFVFKPSQPLSDNLQRFYFPSAPREGKFRRFHIFCAVQGFSLEPDGVTLSSSAVTTINERVRAYARWFIGNNPAIRLWKHKTLDLRPLLQGPFVQVPFVRYSSVDLWIARDNDWQWFAQQFRDFVQNNLRAEGP